MPKIKSQKSDKPVPVAEVKSKSNTTDVRVQKVTKHLTVKLTEEQRSQFGIQAAEAQHEWELAEANDKQAKEHWKGIKAKWEGERNRLSTMVRTGVTYDDVDCNMVFDYAAKRVYVVRLDTKERFDERPMRFDEMQQSLPLEKPKSPEQKTKDAVKDAIKELNAESDKGASEIAAKSKKQRKGKDVTNPDVSDDPEGKSWDYDDSEDEPSFHGDTV